MQKDQIYTRFLVNMQPLGKFWKKLRAQEEPKSLPSDAFSWAPNTPKLLLRPGLCPRPRWGSLQRSTRPTSWIKGGLLLRGGEGKGGRGWEWRGGEGRGRKGEGKLRPPLLKFLDPPPDNLEIFNNPPVFSAPVGGDPLRILQRCLIFLKLEWFGYRVVKKTITVS